jgi:hypothetical protein
MYQLTDKQIDFILDDIRARGVKLDSLQQSLLDHVCCIIEQNLEANGDFESFYRNTIQLFYKKELAEIEEETLLLLKFKHYYTMKRIMLFSGSFGVAGFIIGSFFKIMHWPGAVLIFFFSVLLISLIFLPLVFVLKVQEEKSFQTKFTLAAGTLVAILYCLSALFKVMYWPYANLMWYTSLGIAFLIFIPGFLFTGLRNPDTKVNSLVVSILLVVVFGVQFLLTNLRPNSPTKSFAFIQGEVLLDKMVHQASDSVLKEDSPALLRLNQIFQLCEDTKGILLQTAIGASHIPALNETFEETIIPDLHLGPDFRDGGRGLELLLQLRQKVKEYNELQEQAHQIPVKNSILDMDIHELNHSNNLMLLTNLTETQLLVINLKLTFNAKIKQRGNLAALPAELSWAPKTTDLPPVGTIIIACSPSTDQGQSF